MLYQYTCECGKSKEEFRRVKDRNRAVKCECGQKMKRVIGGYYVSPDLQPYYDDNLETFIQSKRHRQQVMRDRGVYEYYGRGWR